MAKNPIQRPSPEQLLAQVELEERRNRRGRLKVFLGYAAGVGKSFQMLDEGRRRLQRGQDVVVCALQPSYPPEVQEILHKLEIIPTLKKGQSESIDVPAVIHRHPQVALIDGLAYDNPPGGLNAHRWQDVEQLLDANISVIATVNLQYLEKLQDEVRRVTGSQADSAIPRGFLDGSADEIVVVDAPAPEISAPAAATHDRAMLLAERHKLSRLRELALLVAASVVDRQLESYLRSHGIEQPWGVQERILVCVSPHSSATRMLESGSRNADRFQGEFYAAYVQERSLSERDRLTLARNLNYARELGAHVEVLTGFDASDAILKFARQKGITQIFVGHSSRHGLQRRVWGDLVDFLVRSAEGIDVVVYPE
ncbi:MAG: universal stress protein [Candidatus Acidiferrales bacterium]